MENPPDKCQITQLLRAWRGGDKDALDRLTPLIYDDLRDVARRSMVRERAGVTIQATALVNETFLRLAGTPNI